jgi:hypothetical protein
MIAVMIDMDRKLTRIQVDGDLPVKSKHAFPFLLSEHACTFRTCSRQQK